MEYWDIYDEKKQKDVYKRQRTRFYHVQQVPVVSTHPVPLSPHSGLPYNCLLYTSFMDLSRSGK